MSTLRALWLAWGAVVALLAYPAASQTIGEQSGIMGGDSGFLRPVGGGGVAATLTLDAMPYERTVTCGSYTLTGTYTGSVPTWSASPSGASGSCTDTGGGTFSCVVSVAPDATGEGVETITVSNGATDTETIGFPVTAGLSSCFDAHNVDGSYNSTLANADPVASWSDEGPAADDLSQGTGTAQPSFRTSVVGGNPVVRCDGNDVLGGAVAADWAYLHDGNGSTVDAVVLVTTTGLNTIAATSTGSPANRGMGWRTNTTEVAGYFMSDGSGFLRILAASTNNVFSANTFNAHTVTLASADTPDMSGYINGTSVVTANAAAFSTSAPANSLKLCANGAGTQFFLTGDIVVVRTYTASLTSTQRAINKAVDEWRLGGTLPVVPPLYHLDSSDSDTITTAGGSVSSWSSTGVVTIAATQGTAAQQPISTVSGSSSMVDFDGDNDYVGTVSKLTTENRHVFVVATVNSIGSNGVGLSCGQNDGVATFPTYGGIKMRTAGGVAYVVGHNYDGNNDCAETTFALGQVILEMKVDGTNVSVAVDGGSFVSTASGNTSFASENILIGTGSAGAFFSDVAIHEVLWYGDDLDTTKRNAVIAELQTKWGIP